MTHGVFEQTVPIIHEKERPVVQRRERGLKKKDKQSMPEQGRKNLKRERGASMTEATTPVIASLAAIRSYLFQFQGWTTEERVSYNLHVQNM